MATPGERLEHLFYLGFDLSSPSGTGTIRVGCSCCAALVINGVPCHERGCSNQRGECRECGGVCEHGSKLCDDCAEQPEYDFNEGQSDPPEEF